MYSKAVSLNTVQVVVKLIQPKHAQCCCLVHAKIENRLSGGKLFSTDSLASCNWKCLVKLLHIV